MLTDGPKSRSGVEGRDSVGGRDLGDVDLRTQELRAVVGDHEAPPPRSSAMDGSRSSVATDVGIDRMARRRRGEPAGQGDGVDDDRAGRNPRVLYGVVRGSRSCRRRGVVRSRSTVSGVVHRNARLGLVGRAVRDRQCPDQAARGGVLVQEDVMIRRARLFPRRRRSGRPASSPRWSWSRPPTSWRPSPRS